MFAPKFTTRFTATLAATLCFAAATPAFAGASQTSTTETGARQRAVLYSDLDLTTQSGKETLNRRISYAAAKVCETRDLHQFVSCRNAALRSAKEPVGIAIAKAENNARYADAGTRIVVGN
ncbi:MAG: UrcA family protein [Sphingobium phenoxybenzoativorans]|uniref:UrcA family protein n=1 Tax=Sphingobium phenoxybenzoativorans TaxID=1592790 RepID=UPI0008733950|nr:UrcA family protein [Sphingobium phenoxybenzoativorans]